MRTHRFRHHPLLGTVVDVRVEGVVDDATADLIDALVVDDIARLESVFSAFDPDSTLARWKRGEVPRPADVVNDEFASVMAQALHWQVASAGAFNPAAGVMTAIWRSAAEAGRAPTDVELGRLAASISAPRYEMSDAGARVGATMAVVVTGPRVQAFSTR